MKDAMMMGWSYHSIKVPALLWRRKSAEGLKKIAANLGFMSPEHRLVHHFIVRELPSLAEPMSDEFISDALRMPVEKVKTILDDLESHKTFLFRNGRGEVDWAYPVTVDRTPHHLSFDTGEKINAA